MTNFDQRSPQTRTEAAKRAQRLAEELRTNLRKRKDKSRSIDADPSRDEAEDGKPRDRD